MSLKVLFRQHLKYYPVHKNLNFFWGLGSLLTFLIITQIISGLFLSMYYTPSETNALKSIEFVLKEIRGGWLIQRTHVICSSLIFFVLYLHLWRGFYYNLNK